MISIRTMPTERKGNLLPNRRLSAAREGGLHELGVETGRRNACRIVEARDAQKERPATARAEFIWVIPDWIDNREGNS
jgi:hypothetical protein